MLEMISAAGITVSRFSEQTLQQGAVGLGVYLGEIDYSAQRQTWGPWPTRFAG
jgi:hypothetical protein